MDSILYNGIRSQVLASQNVNNARLWGFSSSLEVGLAKNLKLTSSVSYTRGSYKVEKGKLAAVYEKQPNGTYTIVQRAVTTKPLDHIPPIIGKTAVIYNHQKITTELYLVYNGWKHLDQYNPDGEDNAQYATADGMPSWLTLNWKASLNLGTNFQVQLGIENITDRNYRYFASGFSAPGRNFILGFRANW